MIGIARKIRRAVGRASVFRRWGGIRECIRSLIRTLLVRPRDLIRKRRWKTHLANLPSGKPVTVSLGTMRLELDRADEGLSAELALVKTHEPFATELLLRQITPGMTVVDVGSNIGYYAIQEAQLVGATGRVLCLEPNPAAFALLERNLKLNDCLNAIAYQVAISDQSGEIDFFVARKSNVSRVAPRESYSSKMVVKANSLDKLVGSEPSIDLIRMDIEGHEVHALKGMRTILRAKRPLVVIEFHFAVVEECEAEQFFHEMRGLGYRLVCFVFREHDELFGGRPVANLSQVYRQAELDENFVTRMGKVNSVLFLAPRDRELYGLSDSLAREVVSRRTSAVL